MTEGYRFATVARRCRSARSRSVPSGRKCIRGSSRSWRSASTTERSIATPSRARRCRSSTWAGPSTRTRSPAPGRLSRSERCSHPSIRAMPRWRRSTTRSSTPRSGSPSSRCSGSGRCSTIRPSGGMCASGHRCARCSPRGSSAAAGKRSASSTVWSFRSATTFRWGTASRSTAMS